jgi:hypothetical protein
VAMNHECPFGTYRAKMGLCCWEAGWALPRRWVTRHPALRERSTAEVRTCVRHAATQRLMHRALDWHGTAVQNVPERHTEHRPSTYIHSSFHVESPSMDGVLVPVGRGWCELPHPRPRGTFAPQTLLSINQSAEPHKTRLTRFWRLWHFGENGLLRCRHLQSA